MNEILLGGVPLVVLTGIVVGLLKSLGIASRYLPLASLLVGALLGVLANFFGAASLTEAIIQGFVAGAVTSGLYDLGRKTILNK